VISIPIGAVDANAGTDPAIASNAQPDVGAPGRDPGIQGITVTPGGYEMNLFSGGTASPGVTVSNNTGKQFDYQVEVTVTKQPEGVGVKSPDGATFLVMQDGGAWGWLNQVIVSRVAGAKAVQMTDWTKIGSKDLDLFKYDAVLCAWNNQSSNWQNALISQRGWFEDYIRKGGALYIESGGNSGMPWMPPCRGISAAYIIRPAPVVCC